MKRFTLSRTGDFYKGNLHTHTTHSDGKLSVEETIKLYQDNGYNFLGISDHMYYGHYPEYDNDSFLSIPAAEIHTTSSPSYHLLVFGERDAIRLPLGSVDPALNKMPVQELIDYLKGLGFAVVYCHPYWSWAQIHEVTALRGILGIEIYNHECEMEWKCGNGEVFLEHYWKEGTGGWCLATDDAHGTDGACGGYITVKTDDFSARGILAAMRRGSFYASAARLGETAPRILDFVVEDNVAKIWCDPSRDLYFFSGYETADGYWSYVKKPYHGTEDAPVTYGELELPEGALYVKASIQDFSGFNSWSQPIALTGNGKDHP